MDMEAEVSISVDDLSTSILDPVCPTSDYLNVPASPQLNLLNPLNTQAVSQVMEMEDVAENETINKDKSENEALDSPAKINIKLEFLEDVEVINTNVHLMGDHILKNIIDANVPTDTIISLSNGRLGAHGIVLASCSPLLRLLLSEQQQKSNNLVTIILPDITKETMKILLNMAYTGKMKYSKREEQDVFDAMTFLYFAEFANFSLVEVPPIPPEPESVLQQENSSQSAAKSQSSSQGKSQNASGSTPISNYTEEIDVSDDEYEPTNFKKGESQKLIIHLTNDRTLCTICKQTFSCMTRILSHMEENHNEAWLSFKTSPEELQCLTFCNYCGKQLKSIQVANKCLLKHNLVRCYVCFDAIKKTEALEHYKSLHTNNPTMEKKFLTKCRWCTKLIRFDYFGRYLLQHCTRVHIQEKHVKKGDSERVVDLKRKRDSDEFYLKRIKLNGANITGTTLSDTRVLLHRLTEDVINKYCTRTDVVSSRGTPENSCGSTETSEKSYGSKETNVMGSEDLHEETPEPGQSTDIDDQIKNDTFTKKYYDSREPECEQPEEGKLPQLAFQFQSMDTLEQQQKSGQVKEPDDATDSSDSDNEDTTESESETEHFVLKNNTRTPFDKNEVPNSAVLIPSALLNNINDHSSSIIITTPTIVNSDADPPDQIFMLNNDGIDCIEEIVPPNKVEASRRNGVKRNITCKNDAIEKMERQKPIIVKSRCSEGKKKRLSSGFRKKLADNMTQKVKDFDENDEPMNSNSSHLQVQDFHYDNAVSPDICELTTGEMINHSGSDFLYETDEIEETDDGERIEQQFEIAQGELLRSSETTSAYHQHLQKV